MRWSPVVCRSCSTFFIEHDIKFYVFVVLDDNCPTRPTSYSHPTFFTFFLGIMRKNVNGAKNCTLRFLNKIRSKLNIYFFVNCRVQFFAPLTFIYDNWLMIVSNPCWRPSIHHFSILVNCYIFTTFTLWWCKNIKQFIKHCRTLQMS